MAIFPEVKARLLNKKICMKCSTRNPYSAKKCRKCGSTHLRPKKMGKKLK